MDCPAQVLKLKVRKTGNVYFQGPDIAIDHALPSLARTKIEIR
jgi:hypothetical protein